MFDLSLGEILVVVVVAVVFIGPKDLPVVLRAVAKAVASLKGFAHELKTAVDGVAKESGIKEMHNELTREMTLVKGDDGDMYEAYDISDFLPPQVKKNPSDAA